MQQQYYSKVINGIWSDSSDKTYDGSVTATMDGIQQFIAVLSLEIHLQDLIQEYLLTPTLAQARQSQSHLLIVAQILGTIV